jgi:hypothetical protein
MARNDRTPDIAREILTAERPAPDRRKFLTDVGKVALGCGVGSLLPADAFAQALTAPKNLRVVSDSADGVASKTLLTVADLTLKGFLGFQYTNQPNSDLGYSCGPYAVRRVAGERRVLAGTFAMNPVSPQGWDVGDLFEWTLPSNYSANPTNPPACQLISGQRWAASDWQCIGVEEHFNGVRVGASWWDDAQQVLWYTTFGYYSLGPLPVLNAVALGPNGAVTRYGPWHYGTPTDAQWKKVYAAIIPIPAARQAAMGNKTHLMGGQVMSLGSQSHWGLGLTAVNLPPLRPNIGGENQAYNTAAGNRFFIETTQDLSTVPLDGSVWFMFGLPSTSVQDWPMFTQPTAITRLGGSLWQIDGTSNFKEVVGTYVPRVRWALTYRMEDGIPIADFSPDRSGLAWPEYFQQRTPDYDSLSAIYNFSNDPYFGGRLFQYTSIHTGLPQAVPSATSIQLAATATAAVGDFVGWATNVPDGLAVQVRKIVAWNDTSKMATVDAAWTVTPPLNAAVEVRRHNYLTPADWNVQPSAQPQHNGSRGYWQASQDAVIAWLWIETGTRQGLVMWGRQTKGGTWYHGFDTFASFGYVDKECSDPGFNSTFGFKAAQRRPMLYRYDPQALLESASGARAHTSAGMFIADAGDWSAQFPSIPLYAPSKLYPGYSSKIPDPSVGGSQVGYLDQTTNEMLLFVPRLDPNAAPMVIAFALPQ